MKEPCEKPKMLADTIDIGMPIAGGQILTAKKEGSSMKEPYEEPEMVTETIDIGALFAVTAGSVCPVDQAQAYGRTCPPCSG